MNVLVTGSSGLIGSEAVRYFDALGYHVTGVDNNMRRTFFGPEGDTTWNLKLLQQETRHFTHVELDIRDREAIMALFQRIPIDWIVHCAAQPSHDRAAAFPLVDFDVNAVGTLNLLEATRMHHPDAIFAFLSTNKVYGDAPNEIRIKELETRWDYDDPDYAHGISESMRIDRCLHSIFGASKVAADIMVQEYGRYFGMNTVAFRGGCLTGPRHSGVELHGFLSYLVKVAVHGKPYRIFGYKGKQVRDNIHSNDVIRAIARFAEAPRPGEVYNLGGGKTNSISVLEAIDRIQELSGRTIQYTLEPEARTGDHQCYYSDLRKFQTHYPGWNIEYPLATTLAEMVDAELRAH